MTVKILKLFLKTVGMGVEWRGGDMAHNPGGGHKINMLKPVIAEYKERKDLLIMFTDRSRKILNFNVFG